MRAFIQRVSRAEVKINKGEQRGISTGLLILLGVAREDTVEDANWLCNKIVGMRIFSDEAGKMNHSIQDISGSAMIVSQFTLHASTRKGNRPSYTKAAPPELAENLYNHFVELMQSALYHPVMTGEFGAHMEVSLVNDGPVSIMIDSKNKE